MVLRKSSIVLKKASTEPLLRVYTEASDTEEGADAMIYYATAGIGASGVF